MPSLMGFKTFARICSMFFLYTITNILIISTFQCRPIISALIERRIERNEDRLGRLAGKSCCKSCCCNNVSFTHWQKDDAVSNSKSLQSVTNALLLGRWPKMAPPSTAHQRVLGGRLLVYAEQVKLPRAGVRSSQLRQPHSNQQSSMS